MDRELQELVARLEIISNVRNRDRSNFVTFSLEHPTVETPKGAQVILWTVIASQLEPLAQAGAPLPINLIWICFDSGSADYKRVFKRRSNLPSSPYRSTWIALNTYAEIFEEPQYFEFDPALIGSTGERGEKGDKGDRGETGAPSFVQGPKGDKGDTGEKGDRGIQGDRGEQGLAGNVGEKGERGEQGLKGDIGQQGVKGDTGYKGDTGEKGETGAASTIAGPKGEQGIKGDKGERGEKGETGAASTVAGPKGDKGEKGDVGPAGSGVSSPVATESGLIPFTVSGSATPLFERLVQNQAIVETQAELDGAKTVSTSLQSIFNSWRRFSHSGTTFPASVSEMSSWQYDSNTDILKSTVNSGTFIGFVSNTQHESYTHVVTLSSSNADDDLIAVILAFYIDPVTGKEYTLSAIRTAGGLDSGNPFSLYYNFNQPDAYRIAVISDSVLRTYKSGTTSPGWSNRATKVFVTRTGNLFKVRTTQMYRVGVESDAYVAAADLSFNLADDERFAKFMGPRNYGYGCQSQQDASFSDIRFTQNSGNIYDKRDDTVWKFNELTGAYEVSVDKIPTALKRSRIYWNGTTRKLFFYPEGDSMQAIANSVQSYDITTWCPGKPLASAILHRQVCVRAFILPVALSGSLAVCGIAPTAARTILLKKNGVQFASITFAAGSTSGQFAATVENVFVAGDILSIEAPASSDTTFADCSFTLRAIT